jgi:hypothetical protein
VAPSEAVGSCHTTARHPCPFTQEALQLAAGSLGDAACLVQLTAAVRGQENARVAAKSEPLTAAGHLAG